MIGRKIERADVDKGCQGHDAPGAILVFKSGHKRGVHGRIRKEPRRRLAIEPIIGPCKEDGHRGRNFLKGRLANQVNAVMSVFGDNIPPHPQMGEEFLCLIIRHGIETRLTIRGKKAASSQTTHYFIGALFIAAGVAAYTAFAQPQPLEPERSHGRIAHVIDGDTLIIKGVEVRIRLWVSMVQRDHNKPQTCSGGYLKSAGFFLHRDRP